MKKNSSRQGKHPRGEKLSPFVSFEEEDDDGVSRAQGFRHARLCDVFRQELGLLLRDDVADPMLDELRVARVELSPDYRNARVYVVSARVGSSHPVERALERATPFLRARLAEAVELKFVPALRFGVAMGMSAGDEGEGDGCA